MRMIEKECECCGKLFTTRLSEVKRGNGKYCSLKCNGNVRKGIKLNLPNVTCSYCGKQFYKNPSKKLSSKSGLFFCCREHKDLAQQLQFGLTAIHPDHYNNGQHNYREIAFRSKEQKCERCGYDEYPEILEVHHKDRNRDNNSVENLEILCPNCHMIEHRVLTKAERLK